MNAERTARLLYMFNENAPIARTLGMRLSFTAEGNAVVQIHQLSACVHAPGERRPAAIVVETVVGEGLERVARNAVKAGIGWAPSTRGRPTGRRSARSTPASRSPW